MRWPLTPRHRSRTPAPASSASAAAMYSQVRLPKNLSRLLPHWPWPTQALNRPGSSPNWRDSRGRGAAPTAPDQPRRSWDPRDAAGGFPPALGASRQGLKMGLGGDLPSIGKAGRQQRRPDLPPHRRQLRRLDLLPNRGGWKFAMRVPPSSERIGSSPLRPEPL
jgi:hypothetical protein